MVHQLRHRCPKGAATVAMNLRSPRHILTLLALGGQWQYWSRPPGPEWQAGKKTVAAYMSHVWRLWGSQ
jgi:hypothetical protein